MLTKDELIDLINTYIPQVEMEDKTMTMFRYELDGRALDEDTEYIRIRIKVPSSSHAAASAGWEPLLQMRRGLPGHEEPEIVEIMHSADSPDITGGPDA